MRSLLAVELAIRDIFDYPLLSDLADFINLSRQNSTGQAVRTKVTTLKRQSNQLPTSYAQSRLWFIDQMEGGSAQYNMPSAMRFKGQFDSNIVEQALTRVIERHEPLRTIFIKLEDGVEQLIRSEFEFSLNIIDLSELPPNEQQAAVLKAAKADALKPFDLSQDLMLRSSYIRCSCEGSNSEGALLFNMHHIASDGWSMGLLVDEFWQQYNAILHNQPNPCEPLAIQYADYALWQRDFFEGKGEEADVLESQLSYWEKQLCDIEPVHSLPLDHSRPQTQTFNGAHCTFDASPKVLAGLKQLALSQNATLFMVLHGAFSVLLSRHANNNDIVLGVPMANRLQKELEDIIGFFVNTLLLRADCAGNPEFVDFLGQIKQLNLDAQANQDVPFEHLVDRLQPVRSTAHSPLFQIMFTLNNTQSSDDLALTDLTLSPLEDGQDAVVSKFELMLSAVESAEGLSFGFEYNTDLFDASTIKTLGRHFVTLLEGIVANPRCRLGQLPMMSQVEQQMALSLVNQGRRVYPKTHCIHQLFEQQVELRPGAIALRYVKEHQKVQLSYQQLNQK
ncbi:MAG: non-ribosomal peptide synthetase, partial [Algicola sp.]|nr:non-ribosomal peptide synthetase [Algicola sp.]